MTKSNFLLDIFLDYQKYPEKYCLWRWCATCGNRKIRDELFLRSIEELEISFEETGMKRGFLSLGNIRDGGLFTKIVKLICQRLNNLGDNEIDAMLGSEPFYELDNYKDDFLKFVIMEIYSSLEGRFAHREETMNHLESVITNEKINYVIMRMNSRYVKNQNNLQQSVTLE